MTANSARVDTLTRPAIVNCLNTSISFDSMDISNISAQFIDADNMTVGNLATNQLVFDSYFNDKFPNINNLMVTNLTANTAYSTEIVAKT